LTTAFGNFQAYVFHAAEDKYAKYQDKDTVNLFWHDNFIHNDWRRCLQHRGEPIAEKSFDLYIIIIPETDRRLK
jgi:hypothetical protein